MYLAVVPPAAMPHFLAVASWVDVTVSSPSLPDWWLVNAGQCRQNAIEVRYDPDSLTGATCPDLWQGQQNLMVVAFQAYVLGPSTMRINSGAAVPSGSELSVPADGTEFVFCRITISRAKTTGTGACAGCTSAAALVLTQAKLQQPSGVGDYTVTWPDRNNTIWFNESVTPARNRTWGQVKGLYR